MLPFYILWRQKAPHFAGLHAHSQDRMAGPVTSEDYTRELPRHCEEGIARRSNLPLGWGLLRQQTARNNKKM